LRLALRSCDKELRKRPAHCPMFRTMSRGRSIGNPRANHEN
jgi:hypothetical protein